MVPCLPGHLLAWFMPPWSLDFLGLLTLHSLLCIPSLLGSLIAYLLCLVFISLLCLPVHRWSPGLTCIAIYVHACMISYGSACIPSLTCVCGLVYVSLVTYTLS